jgi:hypothetical protein
MRRATITPRCCCVMNPLLHASSRHGLHKASASHAHSPALLHAPMPFPKQQQTACVSAPPSMHPHLHEDTHRPLPLSSRILLPWPPPSLWTMTPVVMS